MCGDAGFLMNIQELETAVRLKLSVIIVVWCDRDLGMISMKQKNEFGKSVFTKFTNPNFIKLAESFGAVGYIAKSTEEFAKILDDAKKIKDIPVVIAIDVDYSRNDVLLNDSHYENV
jgi:acetolactate synthase-1/2/3 large subunit